MTPFSVLIVDDDPLILRVIERAMSPQFDIVTAPSADLALKILNGGAKFAVILSDLHMPGLGGIGLLRHCLQFFPDTVRVLLSGNAHLRDATAAVNDVHVFRLLAKPFEMNSVRLALQAAAEQHLLLISERELLEQTLHGCIKALATMLSITQPAAFGRAVRIQACCSDIATKMCITRKWDIEVAALLSQIGCVTLDAETVDRWYHNRELLPAEQEQIDKLPEVAENLIAGIPRLESVRAILGRQFEASDATDLPVGAAILAVARDFDILVTEGLDPKDAVETLEGRGRRYDLVVLQHLRALHDEPDTSYCLKDMRLMDVQESMTFASDVHSSNGLLLIARGQSVTPALLARLRSRLFALAATQPVRMMAKC